MVWHFIGIYIINRTLHDRLEIQNFSSRVEKYFTSELRSLVKYFSTLEEKFRISARPCNILYFTTIKRFDRWRFKCSFFFIAKGQCSRCQHSNLCTVVNYCINSVDDTKYLFPLPHQCSTRVSLENNPLISKYTCQS